MAKKLSDKKLIEKNIKAKYELKVQDLMDLIPEASVFEKDTSIREFGVFLKSSTWYVGEYLIDSDMHMVWSLDANDKPVPEFYLKPTDYKKFVQACKARREELLKTRKASKSM